MTKWYDNPKGKEEVAEYRDALAKGPMRGRGAGLNPGNRFETVRLHVLGETLDELAAEREAGEAEPFGGPARAQTQVFADRSKSILNRVDSPDLGFGWTINPYRGCEHGCIYCYARPTHETFGLSMGLDFETKIFAKMDAPRLLRRELAKPSWKPEGIMFAGITDIYQPIEAKLRLTRSILEVLAECRQPVGLVTKNRLILRDLDVLTEMSRHGVVHAAVSLTTLDNQLAAKMEPRASSPGERLAAIRGLSEAGIPTSVMVAPLIPGLTDREMPAILQAAADAGAKRAGYVLLRLPYQIKDLFLDWLNRHFPERAKHVESLVRSTHKGELYDSNWHVRHRGEGEVAEQIGHMFKVFRKRYKLDGHLPKMNRDAFRPPLEVDGQMGLFGDV